MNQRKVVILGSTGSIGRNALKVVESHPSRFEVLALAANSDAEGLAAQCRAFRPKFAGIFDHAASARLKELLPRGVRAVASGVEGLAELASLPAADIVLNSVSGAVGFAPLVASIRASKHVALANKEPMVMAGGTLLKEAERWKARIVPVDSEPSAIFQCLESLGGRSPASEVARVFLTASGGAFYRRKGNLSSVTAAEALRHPSWKMGPKITVDSATLMNKGLEAIEIANFFSLPIDRIQPVIHPQSVIHSAVELNDGAVLAQMSLPDMKIPIQYAMTWPERLPCPVKKLDLFALAKLDFARPDFRRFPCLALAFEAGRRGGTFPAVLNAANEVAVELFLKGRIRFTDIPRLAEKLMSIHSGSGRAPGLAEVVEVDAWAREKAAETAARLDKKR